MHKRLVFTEQRQIVFEEYALPEKIPSDQILVRNLYGAEKHGTMTALLHGHANKRGKWDATKQLFVPGGVFATFPIPLGNMQVGIVETVGTEVEEFHEGDRVLHYGPFAPFAAIRKGNIWKLREDTKWKAATCFDPATYALCALRDADIRLGDSVAIFSLGAIGLMAVQIAKLAGCHPIIAVDPLPHRREVALKTGADQVLNPIGIDVGLALRQATDWRGVDAVIEYSGAMEALHASLRGVAFGGTIALGAFPGLMKAGLDLGAEAHMNRPNIKFTRTESDPNRDHPRWDNRRIRTSIHRMILDGLIDAELIVTPVLKFNDKLTTDYSQISDAPEANIKFGVEY